jgi:hypothetical protein
MRKLTIQDVVEMKKRLDLSNVPVEKLTHCATIQSWKLLRECGVDFAQWTDSELDNHNPETGLIGEKLGIECYANSFENMKEKQIKSDHVHIPILNGHITWTGDEPPSKEVMNAFMKMAVNISCKFNLGDIIINTEA